MAGILGIEYALPETVLSNEELAAEYEISSIPCLLVFKDGKESNRNVGLVQKENIIEMMEN